MNSVLRMSALTAICVLASSPLLAGSIVTLDFDADSQDHVTNITVGDNGRIYATLSNDRVPNPCGVFGLDGTGTLISTFASGGRFSGCVTDLQARNGGGFAALEPSNAPTTARLTTRDAAGAVVTAVDFFPLLPASQSATRTASVFDVRSDAKIVIGGGSAPTVLSTSKFAIALLNPDGTAVDAFGGGTAFGAGLVMLDLQGTISFVRAMADGKILATGNSGSSTYVIRLNADGTADASFGANGRV